MALDLNTATVAELEEGLRGALIANHSEDIGKIMAELNRRSVEKFRARNPTWPRDFELTDDERREPREPQVDPQTGYYDA